MWGTLKQQVPPCSYLHGHDPTSVPVSLASQATPVPLGFGPPPLPLLTGWLHKMKEEAPAEEDSRARELVPRES